MESIGERERANWRAGSRANDTDLEGCPSHFCRAWNVRRKRGRAHACNAHVKDGGGRGDVWALQRRVRAWPRTIARPLASRSTQTIGIWGISRMSYTSERDDRGRRSAMPRVESPPLPAPSLRLRRPLCFFPRRRRQAIRAHWLVLNPECWVSPAAGGRAACVPISLGRLLGAWRDGDGRGELGRPRRREGGRGRERE